MGSFSISGVGVALITPFLNDGSIDFDSLGSLIDFNIDNGVDYLVVLGTTGESATLSLKERKKIFSFANKHNNGRVPLVYGIGGNCTQEVVEAVLDADLKGVSAILTVVPYYNKPSQNGIFAHYKAVAEVSPVPIILYNVPSRTGVNMTAETTLRLAYEVPNIVGIKEASGDLNQIAQILKGRPANFEVVSGDDNQALPIIAQGGNGVISVAANAFPEPFCAMIDASLAGNFSKARIYFYKLFEVTNALFAEGNPAGVKAALAHKKIVENNLRLPLVPVSEQLQQRIKQLILDNDL